MENCLSVPFPFNWHFRGRGRLFNNFTLWDGDIMISTQYNLYLYYPYDYIYVCLMLVWLYPEQLTIIPVLSCHSTNTSHHFFSKLTDSCLTMFKKYIRSIPTKYLRSFSDRARKDEILTNFLNTKHLKFENGEKAQRLFSNNEFDRRLANLRWIHTFDIFDFELFTPPSLGL